MLTFVHQFEFSLHAVDTILETVLLDIDSLPPSACGSPATVPVIEDDAYISALLCLPPRGIVKQPWDTLET